MTATVDDTPITAMAPCLAAQKLSFSLGGESGGSEGKKSVRWSFAEQLVLLLTQHQEPLFHFIFSLVGCEADARDILQETSLAQEREGIEPELDQRLKLLDSCLGKLTAQDKELFTSRYAMR